ncbi:hypothetical protein T265_06973 [Opisthorchis viverrini]|uniref:Uncharacterized protein n=1 Tax=Opisthorchis viverrini TaxID=6198 RepID=A0A074ZEM4_OPIVI|nr:hypothetical protein T265_06973 [Opisthorchis viverrini]KER25628.1 hypothetical protein T265_06973 [Opisthorchis viverrini]
MQSGIVPRYTLASGRIREFLSAFSVDAIFGIDIISRHLACHEDPIAMGDQTVYVYKDCFEECDASYMTEKSRDGISNRDPCVTPACTTQTLVL